MYTSVKSQSTVLAVNDSIPVQKLVKRMLEKHYQLVFANNTTEALTVLHQQSIDLMLLDISMPGMDGLELYGWFRTVSSFARIAQFQPPPDCDAHIPEWGSGSGRGSIIRGDGIFDQAFL
ncbi:hypothetical protein NIVACYA_00347 [Planktothrix agardhii]|jgi:CheY-like chemotaxis protein|nr:two-component response regulator [Planktothrix agardhii NIES-204]CAD5910252.1 hypothetical protein NIVACYA_00347 [Planktothrix agardhii]CAD5927987.1 hypothetical protein NO2A_01546 [Planktothrix agardhii]